MTSLKEHAEAYIQKEIVCQGEQWGNRLYPTEHMLIMYKAGFELAIAMLRSDNVDKQHPLSDYQWADWLESQVKDCTSTSVQNEKV